MRFSVSRGDRNTLLTGAQCGTSIIEKLPAEHAPLLRCFHVYFLLGFVPSLVKGNHLNNDMETSRSACRMRTWAMSHSACASLIVYFIWSGQTSW